MLVEFSVNNFKSIKDSLTFSMVSGKSEKGIIKANDKMNLLACSAIFGANASGKTTILKALNMMRRIVLNTDKVFLTSDDLPYEPFKLSTETEDASTSFDIVFIQNGRQYKYGFEYDKNKIYGEYLYEYKTVKPTCVFDMEKEIPLNKEAYSELKNIKNKPDNYLYLWLCDVNGNEPAKQVLAFFKNVIFTSGIENSINAYMSAKLLNKISINEYVNVYMKKADFGIENVKVDNNDSNGQINVSDIVVAHKKYNEENQQSGTVDFQMNKDESFGTYKFFAALYPLISTLAHGGVILYDELDASLHPLLLRKLLELFTDENNNNRNAQIIVTCQDVSLIDYLKENVSQICFTKKDKYGKTIFHSLDEYNGVELKKKLQDLYMLGSFDAIPNLEGFNAKI